MPPIPPNTENHEFEQIVLINVGNQYKILGLHWSDTEMISTILFAGDGTACARYLKEQNGTKE